MVDDHLFLFQNKLTNQSFWHFSVWRTSHFAGLAAMAGSGAKWKGVTSELAK